MLTVTDLFCGAGGSSLGAHHAGLTVQMAINHWKLAIETHNTNFPDTDHDCQDVQATSPRRYRRSDVLIASPECTNHSLAKGARRRNLGQGDLWAAPTDPAEIRSRATMWDVVRFAEVHRYRLIIVENVVDAQMWELWDSWLDAMGKLGYEHKAVSLNSMFCWPTPQSRDRLYIVFWRRGNRAPDLELRPPAPCPRCGIVEARQAWKNGRSVGRYRRQYVFTCPSCRSEVEPFYYAALNAIDFSLPAERIGDRKKPLKPRTLERVRYGLNKYGRQPLQVITNMTTDRGRTRSTTDPMFVQTGSNLTALVSPFVVETMFTHAGHRRAYPTDAPLSSQTGKQSMGVTIPPSWVMTAGSRETAPVGADLPHPTLTGSERFALAMPPSWLIHTRRNDGDDCRVRPATDPSGTQTGSSDFAVTLPPAFLPVLRRNMEAGSLADPLATVCASGGHHALIQPAAVISMRSSDPLAYSLAHPLPVQVASASQSFMLHRSPFLSAYYGGSHVAAGGGEPIPTCTGVDRHAMVTPGEEDELSVEDCYFRMLVPHEVGAAMAFPGDYKVLGNARDRVKQYGNAVTPPAMLWLIERAVASLHPEVARG